MISVEFWTHLARDLVWIAIEEDAGNLRYASEDLRGDAELVLEAVKRTFAACEATCEVTCEASDWLSKYG